MSDDWAKENLVEQKCCQKDNGSGETLARHFKRLLDLTIICDYCLLRFSEILVLVECTLVIWEFSSSR